MNKEKEFGEAIDAIKQALAEHTEGFTYDIEIEARHLKAVIDTLEVYYKPPADVIEARKAADSMETCGMLKDWAIIMALMNQAKYETIARLFRWVEGIHMPEGPEEFQDPYQQGYFRASRMVYKILNEEVDV